MDLLKGDPSNSRGGMDLLKGDPSNSRGGMDLLKGDPSNSRGSMDLLKGDLSNSRGSMDLLKGDPSNSRGDIIIQRLRNIVRSQSPRRDGSAQLLLVWPKRRQQRKRHWGKRESLRREENYERCFPLKLVDKTLTALFAILPSDAQAMFPVYPNRGKLMEKHRRVACIWRLLSSFLHPEDSLLPSSRTCPMWNSSETYTNTDMLLYLTNPCHYDKWSRPETNKGPLEVMTLSSRLLPGIHRGAQPGSVPHFRGRRGENHTQYTQPGLNPYLFVFDSLVYSKSSALDYVATEQLTAHVLIRYRWQDLRLDFSRLAPNAGHIVSEGFLRNSIWTPHVYLVNEQDSLVMGTDQKDVLVAVEPDGMVSMSARMKVKLSCLMDLQKFPFDEQECPMVLESWTYNSSQLLLSWDKDTPVTVNKDLHLPEYKLTNMWSNYSITSYSVMGEINTIIVPTQPYYGRFVGNYSSLEVRFHMAREIGHYIMDYFVPSILLVVVSWVSFWLDPNAVPGRTTLGTSTMLTFITLTRNTGSALPKVSYIKATEIWFIVCTAFIFGSLVEFAFVNTIWRRRKNVELKKVNSKYILKSTLTPQLARKNMGGRQSPNGNSLDRCQSWPTVEKDNSGELFYLGNSHGSSNTLTVNSTDSIITNPSAENNSSADYTSVVIQVPGGKDTAGNVTPASGGFTTMTPQDIAKWIDRRSRLLFPIAFIIFNILYWGFVWI
uniref:Uncharacterized protein n=1 Tax=Timema cristinae TaxID=61476 RepID=A0A7R9CA85_TIMCR|nr:unnamed protein product [Timema cristinae]